ncbi:[citrate (pro-3S)-lyase] ligase [Weissella sagaensis]|uniref:[Citrate [pro-3S]-lyase] ligase n=1 Tax=Weissella sagaensis TaxID=2559928 RepID=A0ABW1RRP5_9LACO|nr:[citrate (pro-3S)-lyase] ligase [Weissella sagaensis]QDJ58523.1 [citrate (pro-3S)-lyase] ligase [Weissella hellenica]QEA57463.1 [citrate (pro-3S)-lyase] ligase [Weissella hellenica]
MQVQDLYLTNPLIKKKWQAFLTDCGITDFSENEVAKIDETIGIYDGETLVATGSIAGQVIKYVAVCQKGVTNGSRFNTILTELINRLMQRGIYHIFVFTKPKYVTSFEHVGFEKLAGTTKGVLLESGRPNINDYLSDIPHVVSSYDKKIAAIVMNANPFTLGHRYLIEKAAKENDSVYVFVVSQDASLFTTTERVKLVSAGVADLSNVTIVNGGDYMVSYTTFPAYFMQSADDVIAYQTTLDARLFKEKIAPELNITRRYLGSEPLSHTTNIYNQTLQRELTDNIAVSVVPRKESSTGQVISATTVRQAIATNQVKLIANMLPKTTMDFIKENMAVLQDRIKKGQKIHGN